VKKQVWSFAPPEDIIFTRSTGPSLDNRSENSLFGNTPVRPLSAVDYRDIGISDSDENMSGLTRSSRGGLYAQDDIEMGDAGPSTAPSRSGAVRTFFHDD